MKWTPEAEELLVAVADGGGTAAEIAARLKAQGVEASPDAVSGKLRRLGINTTRILEPKELIEIPAAPRGVVGTWVGPTIVYWDLETTFSTWPRLLTSAFADGFGNVTLFDLETHPGKGGWIDDSALAEAVRDELEKYEIIVTWWGKRADVPWLNGRLVKHGLRPLNAQMHVDLYSYSGFPFVKIGGRSLEKVGLFFNSPNRKTPLNPEIHDRADHGDRAAYDLIREHNIADVLLTRDIFHHLKPLIRNIHRAG